MDDEASDAIIPGLPDDFALRCLARISHGYHGLLESVSRKWRRVIRSTDYANLKAKEGWCGNWLFVSTDVRDKCMWGAYDPDADRWHPIPRLPEASWGDLSGCSCVSVWKRFLVVGGSYSPPFQGRLGSNGVMMFDPFKQQWSSVSNMRTARANFACAVIHGKVYVAGGNNSTGALSAAEVYDPCTDRWEDLPAMPFPLLECISVSHGDKFHVVGKQESNFEYDTYVILSLADRKWQVMEDMWAFSKLSREYTAVADGHIYTILDDNRLSVIGDKRTWRLVGALPAVALPDHARPLKPFGFCFLTFGRYLFAVGGMALRFDSDAHTYEIVELNTVRFCDPTAMPLEWHDARPMPMSSSSVIGCALVENESYCLP